MIHWKKNVFVPTFPFSHDPFRWSSCPSMKKSLHPWLLNIFSTCTKAVIWNWYPKFGGNLFQTFLCHYPQPHWACHWSNLHDLEVWPHWLIREQVDQMAPFMKTGKLTGFRWRFSLYTNGTSKQDLFTSPNKPDFLFASGKRDAIFFRNQWNSNPSSPKQWPLDCQKKMCNFEQKQNRGHPCGDVQAHDLVLWEQQNFHHIITRGPGCAWNTYA